MTVPSTRRRYLAPLVVALLLLGQGAFLYLTQSTTPGLPFSSAQVDDATLLSSVIGDVRVKTAAGSRQAHAGDRLDPGDRVVVAGNARASIELARVGVLHLDAGSTLERTEPGGRRLELFLHAGSMLVQTTAAGDSELPICHTPHATFVPTPGQDNEFLVLAEP